MAELRRAGLRVPAGFVVTTEAYRAFCQANDLEPWIEENRGDRLRAAFLEAPMPAGLG